MRHLLPVLLVAVLAGACNVQVGENGVSFDVANGRARDEWTRTYTLPEGGQFELVNLNGDIRVTAGTGREVQVKAQREARAGSEEEAQAYLQMLQMQEDVSADRVRLEARGDSSGRRNYRIAYDIQIPAGLVVSFKTENGGVHLTGVGGRMTAATTNGSVTATGTTGDLSAAVVNGGIQIELDAVTGDVEASSVNGAVRIDIPKDAKLSLEATCVNGGISVDEALGMQVSENGPRRVVATLNGGGPRVTTSTVNGGVRIRAQGAEGSGAANRGERG